MIGVLRVGHLGLVDGVHWGLCGCCCGERQNDLTLIVGKGIHCYPRTMSSSYSGKVIIGVRPILVSFATNLSLLFWNKASMSSHLSILVLRIYLFYLRDYFFFEKFIFFLEPSDVIFQWIEENLLLLPTLLSWLTVLQQPILKPYYIIYKFYLFSFFSLVSKSSSEWL